MRNSARFIPTRAGIVNLYEYANQIFELADGRLLLRGHNTSGKTKALELLLPFCLDGDISPRKLDPFASNAKEMKWNLVGCVEQEQRIGYGWLEFARLESGGLRYVTAGVGLKANRGREGVQRWYFVVRDRRVGEDLSLLRGGYPLTRSELAAALDDEDELLGSPSEYRRRLNEVVFGFPSMEQYQSMITLMLQLRRPHLSKGLNPSEVTRLLTAGLPEIDHDLMRRLGEGLEQLDDMQAALSRLEQVRERLRQFNRNAYGAYARAAVADRGDRLRAAETTFQNRSAERRAATQASERAHEDAGRVTGELAAARAALDSTEGEREALLQSAGWASVAEVEQLGETARQAEERARQASEFHERESGRLAVEEAEAITARAAAEETAVELAGELDGLAREAALAGITARHDVLAADLSDPERDARVVAGLMRDEAARQIELLTQHERLIDAAIAAGLALEQARRTQAEVEARLRVAADRRGELETILDGERERAQEAIEAWAGSLQELPLATELLDAVLERALEAGADDAEAPQRVWEDAVGDRRDVLVAERTGVAAARSRLAETRAELVTRRKRLAAEHDEPPPLAHTRIAERAGRPGAPFWALVDFRTGVAEDERAGIEAALEGAGLLDAWVLPGGELLDADTLDVVLTAAGPVVGDRSLARVVQPAGSDAVAPDVVRTILERIALYDLDGAATCAVSTSGEFAIGPARGRYSKRAAEHIGSAARAAARARAIAALDDELAGIDAEDAALQHADAALGERLASLQAEHAAFPDLAPLASARRALAASERDERQALAALRDQERHTATAAERCEAARHEATAHAESAGLPTDLDKGALRAAEGAAERYRAAVGGTLRAVTARDHATARAAEAELGVAAAREAVENHAREAELARSEARRVAAEHAEREGALGRGGDELRARKHEVDARARELRTQVERLHGEVTKAEVARADAVRATERSEEAVQLAARARQDALAAFARLEGSDMFVLALGDDAPGDHASAHEWTLTRALEVLRAIPPQRLRASAGLETLANRVQRERAELDRALVQQGDMSVITQQDADGLTIVRVLQGARERSVPELLARLDTEIDERERTLTAEQRRIFNDTLLEEIAEHLRARIDRVEELVADMNAALAGCPTASGKTVQLEWRPREDDGYGHLRTVTRLLRRSMTTLGDTERAPLIDFFRARIQRARDESAIEGSAGQGSAAHLREAFDYRDWFTFDLIQCRDGQRLRLTAKRHALGSGGEQAVLVHLPLFAAAAAMYASSHEGRAPRLVMLDEALSGIDDETREKVMQALVRLDLDVVMTSHELWGTYRTVPELSIYQLHRDNGEFGVAAEHFLWDGELLHELEQGSLIG